MRTQETEIGSLAHPEEIPRPGVVVVPDVWGLSDHYRDIARRLAGEGFAALALDVYRKTGRPELTDVQSAMRWMRELRDPVVLETLQEGVDGLAAHPAAKGRKVGVIGFCMGGKYALLAGCRCRGVSACAPFYGMLSEPEDRDPERKPESALEASRDLACPLLGLYGEEDHLIPVADVRELERRLPETGQAWEVKLYPGAGHAFFNDTREALYRPEAARDAWSRLVPFLREHLA